MWRGSGDRVVGELTDPLAPRRPAGVEPDDVVVATYRCRAPAGADIAAIARDLAEMQSTGTWVALDRETEAVRERHAGRVLAIGGAPDDEAPDDGSPGHEASRRPDPDARTWQFEVAYPHHNIGDQIPLLLATVYGECASAWKVRLVDLRLPAAFVAAFAGPRFGVGGIRELLGVTGRPLLITMIKPALGLSPAESGQVFLEAALGGVDMIKDDELLVSHPWSDLVARVREHGQAALRSFEQTGQRTLYFVNVTDRPDRLVTNARRAVEAGATGLMVDHLTVGTSALEMLAEDPAIAVPILGHFAFAGAMHVSSSSGVAAHLVMATLPRLAGADMLVYPSPYGSLRFTRVEQHQVVRAMAEPLGDLRPALPMPGGGLHAGMVGLHLADLGIDHAFGAGGAIHGHPMGTTAGAQAIRQAIDAVVAGRPLAEAAREHAELAVALESWPEVPVARGGSR